MSYKPGTAADFSETSEEPRQTFGASGAGVEVLHQVCLFCVFFGFATNWSEYRLCPVSTPASDARTNAIPPAWVSYFHEMRATPFACAG